MTINSEDLLNSILESFGRIGHIDPDEIPNIDLYMDQVTTFMDKKLRNTTRKPDEDKILTKTMINNYAKNDLLPPPVKKKYTKEHVLLLVFIYYYKGILSISDIQALLKPITEKYFGNDRSFKLEDIYNEVFTLEPDLVEALKEDVTKKFELSRHTFDKAPSADKQFLQSFAFICQLSFDVYVKQLLIQKLIDDIKGPEPQTEPKPKKEKKEKSAT